MNVKVVINGEEMTRDDIRNFVQMIREWELKTPKATIRGVQFESNPEITSEEAKRIFEGVFPDFEHLVEIPGSQAQLLRLGARGVVAQGQLMGTCDELTLSIGQASDEEMEALQNADTISLVRMNKG